MAPVQPVPTPAVAAAAAAALPTHVLDYRIDAPPQRRGGSFLFLALSLPALVAPFVPFTHDVSPVNVITVAPGEIRASPDELMLWLLLLVAIPFFLPILAAPLRVRLLVWGACTHHERAAAYAVAALALAAFAVVITALCREPGTFDAAAVLAVCGAVTPVVIGAAAFVRVIRREDGADAAVRVALISPYAATAVLCLVVFYQDHGPGWWLTLPAAAAAIAEMLFLARRPRATS
jgi:hypothetical protein